MYNECNSSSFVHLNKMFDSELRWDGKEYSVKLISPLIAKNIECLQLIN